MNQATASLSIVLRLELHRRTSPIDPSSRRVLNQSTHPQRVFGIFAALTEFERELIRERTLAGLTAARPPRRQDVRAVESPGAAGPGRDDAPRHLRVRALP